VAYSEGGKV